MLTTRMTRNGRVTIPARIRRRLGLQPGDVLVVREEDGKVILERQVELGRSTASALAAYARNVPPLEPAEVRALEEAAIAEEGAETLRQIERDWLSKHADGANT